MGCSKISISMQGILVQRVLCRYCHIFLWTLFLGREKFCTFTCTLVFYSLKCRLYSYFCIKFGNFSKSKGCKAYNLCVWKMRRHTYTTIDILYGNSLYYLVIKKGFAKWSEFPILPLQYLERVPFTHKNSFCFAIETKG